MKIILQISGREMTFSEEELTAIIEKHFTTEATKQESKTAQVAQTPTEGKWFEVNPEAIDQKLFQEERKDLMQEKTRKRILEAFEELKSNPQKYHGTFETMMPEKNWSSKTVTELKELARELGDKMANWVEQALEWAQRITNGESWETVCNNRDTANWYRLVEWKNGYARIVGGSRKDNNSSPASSVLNNCYSDDVLFYAVPLVARYKK